MIKELLKTINQFGEVVTVKERFSISKENKFKLNSYPLSNKIYINTEDVAGRICDSVTDYFYDVNTRNLEINYKPKMSDMFVCVEYKTFLLRDEYCFKMLGIIVKEGLNWLGIM